MSNSFAKLASVGRAIPAPPSKGAACTKVGNKFNAHFTPEYALHSWIVHCARLATRLCQAVHVRKLLSAEGDTVMPTRAQRRKQRLRAKGRKGKHPVPRLRAGMAAATSDFDEHRRREYDALAAQACCLVVREGFLGAGDSLDVGAVCSSFAQLILGQESSWKSLLRVACSSEVHGRLFVRSHHHAATSALPPEASQVAGTRRANHQCIVLGNAPVGGVGVPPSGLPAACDVASVAALARSTPCRRATSKACPAGTWKRSERSSLKSFSETRSLRSGRLPQRRQLGVGEARSSRPVFSACLLAFGRGPLSWSS